MSSVVKDGDPGSWCRPGSAPGKTRAYALGYDLPPLRGSGGGWKHNGVTCGRASVRLYKMLSDHV